MVGLLSRGVVVSVSVAVGMAIFVPMTVHSGLAIVFFCLSASLMMSLIGLITGLWADKFDHLSAITNFVVTPLSFLSGTFYSIDRLPEWIQAIAHANPFFYLIDGFRFGFLGMSDSPVLRGALIIALVDVALWILCQRLITKGYKLKA
ncbi:MAG: ABC transporter permease [Minwuiales bacterium]|nr:ABC transporter permease [Minwuiales bacterium]